MNHKFCSRITNLCNNCTAGIKRYKSKIKNKKKKFGQIVLLGKRKLNCIEVVISKALTESYFSHDEFALVNDALYEYHYMIKKIKILKAATINQKF